MTTRLALGAEELNFVKERGHAPNDKAQRPPGRELDSQS